MLKVGTCKCEEILKLSKIMDYDFDNFEGDVVCQNCSRTYHIEIKHNVVKLGRCRKIWFKPPKIPHYVLGQGVGQNY